MQVFYVLETLVMTKHNPGSLAFLHFNPLQIPASILFMSSSQSKYPNPPPLTAETMCSNPDIPEEREDEEEEVEKLVVIGSYGGMVRLVEDPMEEIMLVWGIQQPTFSKQNAFVAQSSLTLKVDACGHSLSIFQSPSSLGTPGVTGSVMWDSGIVLGKFLEHAVDTKMLSLHGKKVIELGSGCGLVGCIAALLGAQCILTDLPDRLRLLRKNVESNLDHGDLRGSATVGELVWGDDLDTALVEPLPDYVIGSDVVYSEEAVTDLITTLVDLCGAETTVFLAGELRNDAILECFLEAVMKEFVVGRVEQTLWHPDYHSPRVAIYVLIKK